MIFPITRPTTLHWTGIPASLADLEQLPLFDTPAPKSSETVTVFLRYLLFPMLLAALSIACPGCRFVPSLKTPRMPQQLVQPNAVVNNPLALPLYDRMLVMDEVSDELDNYLPVLKEERPRLVDGVLSEGWIETRPTIGGQIFEPWRRDSTPGFEKLQSTLQTIRRFAKVRVIPTAENYLVDIKVYKELEDLPQPLNSTVSGRPLRFDNTLDREFAELFDVVDSGWIPLGRDYALEQRILQGITARFAEIARHQQTGEQPDQPVGIE